MNARGNTTKKTIKYRTSEVIWKEKKNNASERDNYSNKSKRSLAPATTKQKWFTFSERRIVNEK